MGADGQQPYYSSPGYLQHSVPYGSEVMPCYSWNSAYVGDVTNGTNGYSGKSKSSLGSNASMKSNGFNSTKPTGALASKFSALPLDSKSQKTAAYSNIYKSNVESQPIKTSSKVRVYVTSIHCYSVDSQCYCSKIQNYIRICGCTLWLNIFWNLVSSWWYHARKLLCSFPD